MAEVLAWGKPTIKVKKLGSNGEPTGSWIAVHTPEKDTTKLTVTKGEKQEAKIEGGENEAVRYTSNNYALEFTVRSVDGRDDWVADVDGIVSGEYLVALQPENAKMKGIQLDRCVISVEDSFDTNEGFKKKYTCDVLVPKTGSKCKRVVVSFT